MLCRIHTDIDIYKVLDVGHEGEGERSRAASAGTHARGDKELGGIRARKENYAE